MRIHTCPINIHNTGDSSMYTYATGIGAVGFGLIAVLTLDSAPNFSVICFGVAAACFGLMQHFDKRGE